MTDSNNTTASLLIRLRPDHVEALAALVELGKDERLERFSAESDYSNEDIAQGHYEIECAEEAVEAIRDAMNGTQDDNSLLVLKRERSTSEERAYWSDDHGWTGLDNASHFTPLETVNNVRHSLLLSLGDECDFVALAPNQATTNTWAIFSASEAQTENGRGYWNDRKGWVTKDEATRYPIDYVGLYGLPQSLNQDRRWLNLNLAAITTEAGLIDALRAFCQAANLPKLSADELLHTDNLNIHPARLIWLEQFIEQWDAVTG